MATVTAYEAKTKLSEFLRRAEKGERITITRHGTPVAELVPLSPRQEFDPVTVREAIREIREIGAQQSLEGLTIRDLIDGGRR